MESLPTRSVRPASAGGGTGPAQVLAGAFAVAILAGTALLMLPAAQAPGAEITVLDALFTATSAVCVTGLTVLDTGAELSRFGQAIVLLLFQLGGLGILSVGALAALLVGRRAGVQERLRLHSQVQSLQLGGVLRLLRRVALLVFGAEAAGFLLTWPRFAQREGVAEGAFHALFHAVSAFTNSGFGLYPDSMRSFVGDPFVLLPLFVLLVLGSFGFLAFMDLARGVADPRRGLLLTTRIAAFMTVALLVLGFAVIAVLEWRNPATLGPLSLPEKLWTAAFGGATPRTTGLSVMDMGDVHPATTAFVMLLMFIGGNPGSTAGGIKTVTFFVLAGSAWSLARGRGELQAFGRRVATASMVQAGVVAFLASVGVAVGTTVLLATDGHLGFERVAFEAVSALGTVGLSKGITPELSTPGRWTVIVMMFMGRLGPLTAALALVQRGREPPVRRPAEDVLVG